MVDNPIIANQIIKFSGEATEDQIPHLQVINDIADKSIDIDDYKIGSVFGRDFKIPDYQRGYNWDNEQWEQLWKEIEPLLLASTQSTTRDVDDVFFGSVFFSKRSPEDSEDIRDEIYEVIDGQQRITTLSIIFYIIRNRIKEAIQEESSLFDILGEEPGNISNLIFQSSGAGAANTPALELSRHNKDFYESLLGGESSCIKYLLASEVKHPQTKDNVIKIKEYLDKLGIEESSYFKALNNANYYTDIDDSTKRPNLWKYQKDDIDQIEKDNRDESDINSQEDEDSVGEYGLELSDDTKNSILNNKVRIVESNLKLLRCYHYFRTKLEESVEDYDSEKEVAYALTNIKNYVLNSFLIGYFQVDDDNPMLLMKIFEILNDRGMELNKTDVIRTRIVSRFRGNSEESKYINIWESIVEELGSPEILSNFLQTYFVVAGDVSSRGETKNRLLEAFVHNPSDDQVLDSRLERIEDAKSFLEELEVYAKSYHHIIEAQDYGIELGKDGDPDTQSACNRVLIRLRKTGTSIWEPLILAVYHDVRTNSIGKQNFLKELLQEVESMVIRNFVAMDTNVRDRIYANAIREYHKDGIDGDLVEELTDIESDAPEAYGQELVSSMYRTEWRRGWGKQTLRKIASDAFDETDEDDQVVLRELNTDENLVHLEHILPKSPIFDDGDEYAWFSAFFMTDKSDLDISVLESGNEDEIATEIEDLEIEGTVEGLIEKGKKELLENIAEEYIHDIGNQLLLRYRENIQIGNDLFGKKLSGYEKTDGFCELKTSQYICEEIMTDSDYESIESYAEYSLALEKINNDNWEDYVDEFGFETDSKSTTEEKIEDKLEELSSFVDIFDSHWTYKDVAEHRSNLVEELCSVIAIDADEFEDVDFTNESKNESERRSQVIAANYRRNLE